MANLYKRGSVWWGRLRIAGKETRKPLSKDKKIAFQKLSELITLQSAHKYGHPIREVSVESFRERYLEFRKNKPPGTQDFDRRALTGLGEYASRLDQVTPELLEKIHVDWQGRGIYTANRHILSIKTAMRKAEDWNLILPQKWDKVKHFKEPRGRVFFYSTKELETLLRNPLFKDNIKTFILLGARAGLRRSEMYWLAWEDIDWERKQLRIGPKEGWVPKDYEERWIPMSKDLEDHLKSIKNGSKWVLGDDRVRPDAMTKIFKKVAKGKLHHLRHTFASHLVSNGVELHTVAKLLGHSDTRTTQIYAHLAPKTLRAAISKLPKI